MTGVAFDLDAKGDLGSNPLAPSLDRIDAHGPYRTSNVLVVLWAFNRFRMDMPLNEAVALLKRLKCKGFPPITG